MNVTLWCYLLNESSFVELLLCGIFFGGGGGGGGGFLKKEIWNFVSFPFSALKSEMQLTLSILFYVTVGVAEN